VQFARWSRISCPLTFLKRFLDDSGVENQSRSALLGMKSLKASRQLCLIPGAVLGREFPRQWYDQN